MESSAQMNRPLRLSLHHHHRPSLSKKPISLIPLRAPSKTKVLLKASLDAVSSSLQTHHAKPPLETLKPQSPLLKTAACITIATASLLFASFNKLSIAAPVARPTVESTQEADEAALEEEREKILEQHLSSNPQDIDALRTLMEIKLKDQKLMDAVSIVDRLIQIQPSEKQWLLLRAHLHSYAGDIESAKLGFEDILSDDPLFVEAYHGLAMALSKSDSGEMETLLKRIENAMEQCENEKRNDELRDFRLLVAQVKFIDGNYVEALKVYEELVKEEPRDFRPYLYQGIIYTLLRQTNEAKKQFDKYRRLVPKDHPYARYFEDNVMATKAFTQMIGSSRS